MSRYCHFRTDFANSGRPSSLVSPSTQHLQSATQWLQSSACLLLRGHLTYICQASPDTCFSTKHRKWSIHVYWMHLLSPYFPYDQRPTFPKWQPEWRFWAVLTSSWHHITVHILWTCKYKKRRHWLHLCGIYSHRWIKNSSQESTSRFPFGKPWNLSDPHATPPSPLPVQLIATASGLHHQE